MTVAAASTGTSGVEALVRSIPERGNGGHRNLVKHSDDDKSRSDDDGQQDTASQDVAPQKTKIVKTETAPKHKHSDPKTDDDSSFEDTFDSIGQDQSQDTNAKSTNVTATGLAAVMEQISASTVTTDATSGKSVETQQAASRPPILLHQKSILALIDAKDRIFTKTDDQKSDAASSDVAASTSNTAMPTDDSADAVTVTVNQTETHWNFTPDAVSRVSARLQAMQSDDKDIAKTVVAQASASLNSAKQQQTADATPATDKTQQSVNQRVAIPNVEQKSDASSSNAGGNAQGGAQSQPQTTTTAPTARKTSNVESSASSEKIFETKTTPQPSPASVTTQVRDGVLDTLKSGDADTSITVASDSQPTRSAVAPVIKTLDLTLSPPDLGSVTLRMSLKSNELSIEAEASKASTAKLLNDDRPNLERGLKDAGYDISSVKITDVSASSSSNASGWQTNGSPGRDGDQARSSFAGRQDGDMQRRDGSSSGQSQSRSRDSSPQKTMADIANARPGNGVYI